MSVRIRLNHDQVRKFLASEPGVVADITRRTKAVHAAAGGTAAGFEYRIWRGKNRVRGSITAVTGKAREAQARDHVLERALDAGR